SAVVFIAANTQQNSSSLTGCPRLFRMSILIVQLAPRRRLSARGPGEAEPEPPHASSEYSYVLSPDGTTVVTQGQCPASLLPRADTVVLVLADTDVSWHRITLPKAAQAKMRTALIGVLEESLLDETNNIHLALEPQPVGGEPTWVAAVGRA